MSGSRPAARNTLCVRIAPRASLTVQLIQEANFGSGRFEPFGPALSRPAPGLDIASPSAQASRDTDTALLSPPVETKPEARAGDLYTCDGRLVRPGRVSASWCEEGDGAAVQIETRERVVPMTLPSHLAGSLLDVLA